MLLGLGNLSGLRYIQHIPSARSPHREPVGPASGWAGPVSCCAAHAMADARSCLGTKDPGDPAVAMLTLETTR